MKKDEKIIKILKSKRGQLTPVDIAGLLDHHAEDGLTQGSLVTYFKRAFPDIPLRKLIEAGSWSRISDGDLSDEDINEY